MRLIPYLVFALALVGFVWFGVAKVIEGTKQIQHKIEAAKEQ